MNWGKAIFIFFACYVLLLIAVLVQSLQMDHHLVADDYYAKDLAYQKHLEKVSNYAKANHKVRIDWNETSEQMEIQICAGKSEKKGTVHFYFPANPDYDITHDFSLIQQEDLFIPTTKSPRGRVIVQLNWNDGQLPYYFEKEIYLQ